MIIGESSDTIFPIYLHKSFKIFLKSVTLWLITHPYNPKYSRLQNENRFHVNANGHLYLPTSTYIVGKYIIHLHSLRNRPDKLSKDALFTSSITLTANLIHGSYIITLGIKDGQNININSKKTGFITFHQ